MKLSVHIKGEVLALAFGKGTDTIRSIGESALARYTKLKCNGQLLQDKVVEIRKTNGGALLDQDDTIKDVLDDNDFVSLSK